MSDPIRITRQELDDPKVDELLAEQQSFGFSPEPATSTQQPLYFKPWFALMIAGALGALLAWAIIEPGFDDGLRFSAVIDAVEPVAQRVEGLAEAALRIQGVQVLVFSEGRVVLPGGKPGTVGDLAPGDAVEILAEPASDSVYLAKQIRRLDPGGAAPGPVDFSSLASRNTVFGFLLFPLTAGFTGLFIGAADGLLSRAWRRALISGAVGLGVGFLAGCLATIPAGLIYQLGGALVEGVADDRVSLHLSSKALVLNIMRRGLAWAVVGIAAGIGQGVALRSRKLVVNGLIGGMVGSLVGGMFFDPIDLLFDSVMPSGGAEVSRMVGIGLIGAGAGFMIGVVELVARESWVRLLTGPIAGKEFVLYRNPTWIGSSPKSEIYLFKDPQVAPRHAAIHRVGEHYEIEDQGTAAGTGVGGQRVKRRRLRDRDRVTVGQTMFEFRMRDE